MKVNGTVVLLYGKNLCRKTYVTILRVKHPAFMLQARRPHEDEKLI